MKPFKGQLSKQRADKNDSWLISSGKSEIDDLREFITSSGKFEFEEHANLLLVCRKVSLTIANNPFAAFPNAYSNSSGGAHWAAPQQGPTTASDLRKAVTNTDWARLFEEGSTQSWASASWSASEQRCEKLQALCTSP